MHESTISSLETKTDELESRIKKLLEGEPHVVINGKTLNMSQAMTLRVALTTYHTEMSVGNPLGRDKTGKAIQKGYKDRAHEILMLMLDK